MLFKKKRNFLEFLKKTPVQLIIFILVGIISAPFFSVQTISVFYTFSQILKDLLILSLPFIIFFYLAYALSSFENAAPSLILATILLVVLSNATSVLTVYFLLYSFIDKLCEPLASGLGLHSSQINALYALPVKKIISTEWAMLSALTLGGSLVVMPLIIKEKVIRFISCGRECATLLLKKIFVPILPLYVFGFTLKLCFDGDLLTLAHSYGKIFIFCVLLIVVYTFLFYFVANQFNLKKTLLSLKEMIPAGLTGFSTMSSAAAMPLTLQATENNLKRYGANINFGQFVVPMTTNIHLIGDGISLSLTALSLLYMTGHPLPSFETYLIFTFWYCIAKFSTAGVPGAGVIIILPVMQTYLNLNAELSGILTTIYILKDGLLTATNVMGNGAFALLSYNIFKRWIKI